MNNMPEIWFPKLGIQIARLSKTAFTVFGIPLYWYGVFVALGVAVGFVIAYKLADKYGLGSDVASDFAFYAIIFGMIGARVYYVAFSWDNYKGDLMRIFALREGGLSIYGGVVFAVITACAYAKLKKIDLGLLTDCFVPALAAGQAIGRWGNFFNREAFGGFTNTRFAMRYMTKDVSFIHPEVLEHVLNIGGAEYIQVHPAFLYESVWNLCLCLFLISYSKRKKFNGEVFALYLAGYALGRFWIEGLRTDQLTFLGTGLAVSQLLSVVLFVTGAGLIVCRRRRLAYAAAPAAGIVEYLGTEAEEEARPEAEETENESEEKADGTAE